MTIKVVGWGPFRWPGEKRRHREAEQKARATVFLCYGDQQECISCGGWVYADPMPGEERGPFDAPLGSRAPGRYCSERCWREWQQALVRQDAARYRQINCCRECGFDNREHAEGCTLYGVDDHRAQVKAFGERGRGWDWTGPWQPEHIDGDLVAWRRPLEWKLAGHRFPFTLTVAA